MFRLYLVEFTLCLLQIKTLSLYFIAPKVSLGENAAREKSVLQRYCDSVLPVLHRDGMYRSSFKLH